MRRGVWLIVGSVAMMMSAAAAHAAGAGKFSCAGPNGVSVAVLSYTAPGSGRTAVTMQLAPAAGAVLRKAMTSGATWSSCTLGPEKGGAGTSTLTNVAVTEVNNVKQSGGPAANTKLVVNVKLNCVVATAGGKKK